MAPSFPETHARLLFFPASHLSTYCKLLFFFQILIKMSHSFVNPNSILFPVTGLFLLVLVFFFFNFSWIWGVTEGKCVCPVHLHEADDLRLTLSNKELDTQLFCISLTSFPLNCVCSAISHSDTILDRTCVNFSLSLVYSLLILQTQFKNLSYYY